MPSHFAIAYLTMIVTGFGFLLMVKEDGDRLPEEMATQDALTGIANRRSFLDKAGTLSRLCQRTGQPLGLIMVDIDRFKRDIDLLARIGGEEFAIVLPGADAAAASATANRLRTAVEDAAVAHAGRQHRVTISLGIATLGPEGLDPGMALADTRLYAAKAAGRNRVVDR